MRHLQWCCDACYKACENDTKPSPSFGDFDQWASTQPRDVNGFINHGGYPSNFSPTTPQGQPSYGYLLRGSVFSYVGYSGTNISHDDIYVKNIHEHDGMLRGTDIDGYTLEFAKDRFKGNSSSGIKYAYDGD